VAPPDKEGLNADARRFTLYYAVLCDKKHLTPMAQKAGVATVVPWATPSSFPA
jgi:hypothetical protein